MKGKSRGEKDVERRRETQGRKSDHPVDQRHHHHHVVIIVIDNPTSES